MDEEIYKQIEITEYEFYNVIVWLIDNNINFRHPSNKYTQVDKLIPRIRDWETGLVYWHGLYFQTAEDYIAFKLRWL